MPMPTRPSVEAVVIGGPGEAERPGFEEGRDDDAEDDEVVAVEGDRYPAEQDGPDGRSLGMCRRSVPRAEDQWTS